MSTFDKTQVGAGIVQYATRVKTGDVGRFALLPGDPDRVDRIARHLTEVREVANNREFKTATGKFGNTTVTATSTGVGCPSTSIAVEELARAGTTHFIRVGSTAALQPHIQTGDIIINVGTLRNDGTSRAYVPENFPAVPDHFLTRALIDAALELQRDQGFGLHVGLNACDDAFYAETPEWIQNLARYKLLNVEMESSAVFTVAHQRGLSAAMVCAVSGNLVAADFDYNQGEKGNQRLVQGWEHAIEIALNGILRYQSDPMIAMWRNGHDRAV
jgi:uridine phosphorylase